MRDSENISIRGLSTHIHHAGPADGPVLFLLHGLLDTGASFAPLAEHLPGLRLIAPDWRGHGDSDNDPNGYWFPDYVADLEVLVDCFARREGPTPIVAHSMGGSVASLFAGLRPERVSHLVCLDSLNVPDTPAEKIPRRYRGWLDAQSSPPQARLYDSLQALAQRIKKRYPELSNEHIQQLAQDWSRPTADGRIRLANDPRHRIPFPYGFRAADNMAVWRQVTARVLCLDGAESPASQWTSEAEMARRRACFADVTHICMPGCGHMLHLQQPKAVAEQLQWFLHDHATN